MKWFLVLYFAGVAGAQVSTSIGPYDSRDGCVAIGQLAVKDGWRVYCYPVGKIPLQPAAKTDEKPAEKTDKKIDSRLPEEK